MGTENNYHSVYLSVVIPVFNEEENIEPLVDEIQEVLDKIEKPYEILLIDDCSTDGSYDVMKKLRQIKPCLRILRHRINFGQSAGQATGFAYADGEIIITMDGDQQNDPADIPALLDSLKDDVAAVCGMRRKRMDSVVKRYSSKIANAYRNFITGDKISDAGCTFRAIRRDSLRQIQVFNGMHRFLPTLLRFQGYKVVEIPVNHRPRMLGYTKYGIGNRLWRGIIDCFAMRWIKKRAIRGDRVETEYLSKQQALR
ncbi:MAG: Undecaprenyl-phosphate 4-deoxy-4-formamido-L-arabinose transferase [Syntrophus sp. PtaB.Bin001]|nr:MAG: Undecaprenyl-phosphate 4-deoxy-4-formamido-L-arabinose transferase [Syntrophus sp. PtaB.Bin001]